MKKVIFIFGARWALTGGTATQRPWRKVRFEEGEPVLLLSEI